MPDTDVSIPTTASLLALLVDIERLSRESGSGVSEETVQLEIWDGVAYRLSGGSKFVSAMSEVSETMPYPNQVTAVPGTKPWVVGLANVRGHLLPIIDMQLYLGMSGVVCNKHARVLVIRLQGLHIGLLVSEVLGIRHFDQSQVKKAPVQGALAEYVENMFQSADERWPVFKLSVLADNPDFRVASV